VISLVHVICLAKAISLVHVIRLAKAISLVHVISHGELRRAPAARAQR